MTTRYVSYCSFIKLTCAWATDKTIVLCLQDSGLIVQPQIFCDNTLSTIEALVCQAFTASNSCQSPFWQYTFSYDDTLLTNPSAPLASSDIIGVFCKDCLTTWIEEQNGTDVIVVTEGDGSQTIVSEHGCEYPINAPQVTSLFFGNGADGALVVNSVDQLLTFPARNYFFTDLTINAAKSLHPYGCPAVNTPVDFGNIEYFQIFVSGTLTINGAISADGGAGSGITGGNKGAGASIRTDGPGGGEDAGGDGGVAGGAGNPPSKKRGSAGGFMGGGLGGASGAGGVGGAGYTPIPTDDGNFYNVSQLLDNFVSYNSFINLAAAIIGGGCAGAGGGGGANTGGAGGIGGGGGGGAGSIYIAARHIVINSGGKISAKGGAGANGAAGVGGNASGGGGGGGGGGGLVYLIYETLTNAGTIDVTAGVGGTGGAKVGTGTVGSPGVSGSAGKAYKLNVKLGIFE